MREPGPRGRAWVGGMPREAAPLPDELRGEMFTVREAARRGVTRGRMSRPDLATPFRTVRRPRDAAASSASGTSGASPTSPGAHDPRDPRELAAAYALRQGPDQVVSHTTALLLWGAPLPSTVEREQRIHVSSTGSARPRTRHTIPHQLYAGRAPVTMLGDLHLTMPAVSWVMSAPLLGLDALVAAGDYLVTGTEPFDGRPPLTTIAELTATVAARPGDRGIRRAREALELVRYGALSPRETAGRLMLVRAGLPEPELNYTVADAGDRAVAMVDLAFARFRTAVEYESLLHLDPEKFRRDIRKQQELEAIDWAMHRLTADDVDANLRTPASRAAVARIRAALLSRGWRPGR